jgi:gluconate 2-dehydrogenase gamma chain
MNTKLDLDRRSLLERMAFLLGVAALPGEALARAAAPRAKQFLDAGRMKLLTAVADTMIPKTDTPGALDAKVPAKFDSLLVNWAAPARRVELVGALAKIDALAMAQEKMGFVALTPEKRNALLTAHDAAALKTVPDTRHLKGMEAMMAGPSVADPAYGKLRELIILLFFNSEEALTSVLTYEAVPGGWTPSVKVTPETRNTGGMGMF